ncbi:hypothetical protein [Hyphobacterium sp.]|uniref:hypothetical protein n=1 Tax=Hyphobacterium sp. TaxID=2004662 RepID=UPI003BAD79B4
MTKAVRVEDGHLVIDVKYEYNIHLSRIDTPEKVVSWVYHLTEKTWMTTEVLREVLKTVSNENGIDIHLNT